MARLTPVTALPQRKGKDSRHICRFPPPLRVGERTRDGLWTDREWKPGERARYAAEVLGQQTITPDTEV